METRLALLDLSFQALRELFASWGEPAFRAQQVWDWLYRKLATSAAQMTNLPAPLRQRLDAEMGIELLERVYEQRSADRHTIKWLFRLRDGLTIETVLMLYDARRTVCISTQAGCAMGCVFCATGQAGLARNLTAGEIVAQVLYAARFLAAGQGDHEAQTAAASIPLSAFDSLGQSISYSPEFPGEESAEAAGGEGARLTNVVLMGMGEPFANYERVWQAVRIITDGKGFNLGARHITVSTVGLPQGIRMMADEPLQINLAVSLHAPNDALRARLLPVNRRFPIAEVMAALGEYIGKTNRRVTFEYAMMAGINDAPEMARQLASLLKPLRSSTGGVMCHVNLIPLNPVAESPYQPSAERDARAFQGILERAGIPATVRMRRGIDIDAGCGQLRRRVTAADRE